jgi:hypothetical protein
MEGKIGIGQEARKHKERGDGLCPRWFTLVSSRGTLFGKMLGISLKAVVKYEKEFDFRQTGR